MASFQLFFPFQAKKQAILPIFGIFSYTSFYFLAFLGFSSRLVPHLEA